MTEQNHHDPAELDKLTEKFTVLPNDNPASDAKRAELIDKPAFGQVFSDNMAHMTWTKGEGWGDRRIEPYAPLKMDPGASVLHYAQECFEGLKPTVMPMAPPAVPSGCERRAFPELRQASVPAGTADRRFHRFRGRPRQA
mgnify:CR=1 FL=1